MTSVDHSTHLRIHISSILSLLITIFFTDCKFILSFASNTIESSFFVLHERAFQALELLVEKCLSSEGANFGPSDALKRVFEGVGSGLFLPGNLKYLHNIDK